MTKIAQKPKEWKYIAARISYNKCNVTVSFEGRLPAS